MDEVHERRTKQKKRDDEDWEHEENKKNMDKEEGSNKTEKI